MQRIQLSAFLCAFSAAFIFGACGTDLGGGGTTVSYSPCKTNADCSGVTKVCSAGAGVCVDSCALAGDCKESMTCKVSGTLSFADGGTADGSKVCGCTSDSHCSGGFLCNKDDGLCVPPCGSGSAAAGADGGSSGGAYACATGSTCDSSTKLCKKPAGCSPACGAGQTCDTSGASPTCVANCSWATCTGGKVCNFGTGKCEAAATCSGTTQPGACSYGQFCNGTACQEVAKPTCQNFTAGSGKTPVWASGTSTGPIIWGFTDEATDDQAFCTGAGINGFTATLKAYRTDMDWPTTLPAMSGFFYVKVDGSPLDATASMRPSGYVPSGRTATFKVTLCNTATNNLSAGFYFTNGNEFCAALTR